MSASPAKLSFLSGTKMPQWYSFNILATCAGGYLTKSLKNIYIQGIFKIKLQHTAKELRAEKLAEVSWVDVFLLVCCFFLRGHGLTFNLIAPVLKHLTQHEVDSSFSVLSEHIDFKEFGTERNTILGPLSQWKASLEPKGRLTAIVASNGLKLLTQFSA